MTKLKKHRGWVIDERSASEVWLYGPSGQRQRAQNINDAYRVIDHACGEPEPPVLGFSLCAVSGLFVGLLIGWWL